MTFRSVTRNHIFIDTKEVAVEMLTKGKQGVLKTNASKGK